MEEIAKKGADTWKKVEKRCRHVEEIAKKGADTWKKLLKKCRRLEDLSTKLLKNRKLA